MGEVFGYVLFWAYLLPLVCCLLCLPCFAGLHLVWFGLDLLSLVLLRVVSVELLLLVGFDWFWFVLLGCYCGFWISWFVSWHCV